ncbi:MAG: helix-turn-helix transcriptional regulator [Xanthomonadaceae bacterium]|nr:helix-turn-helix transcriptional regulator [Xanthomonadaceae bacterium]
MTDTTPSGAVATLVALDGNRTTVSLSPADAAAEGPLAAPMPGSGSPVLADGAPVLSFESSLPVTLPAAPPSVPPGSGADSLAPPSDPPKKPAKGSVFLRAEVLIFLRHQKLLSQQDMADDCERRHIRLSIATIKRAELGEAVRYRTAREFSRYFGVAVELLLRDPPQ